MHTRKMFCAALFVGAAALVQSAGTVKAQVASTPLFNLYNTGINPGINAAPDLSYTVGVRGSGVSAPAFYTDMNSYPVGGPGAAYAPADNATSRFISPQPSYANGQTDQLNTTYEFTTTFSLAGFDPTKVSIQGRFEADDRISDILVNGHSIGFSKTDPAFTGFTPYLSLSSQGFLTAGTNTLQFEIFNLNGTVQNPVAFRAEYLTAVPEPSTYAMLAGLGTLCFVGSYLRRRQAI